MEVRNDRVILDQGELRLLGISPEDAGALGEANGGCLSLPLPDGAGLLLGIAEATRSRYDSIRTVEPLPGQNRMAAIMAAQNALNLASRIVECATPHVSLGPNISPADFV